MDIKIEPSLLRGSISAPSSKSMSHRMIICAALASGKSVIKNVSVSRDIEATIECLRAFGAKINVSGDTVEVDGVSETINSATADCCESGSTLRFLIPVAASLGIRTEFIGSGKLPQRPITPYLRELTAHGISFDYRNTMPFMISGKLSGGVFSLEGDISSQFITGLLLSLPLCRENSEIKLLSQLQSKPYADMTVECMRNFGVTAEETNSGYIIEGNQRYSAYSGNVEGDYSQAAFFFVANALGSDVNIGNLSVESCQGDKKILEIIEQMCYNEKCGRTNGYFCIDVSDIPDLVPILAVLGCFGEKTSYITNAARLKIKESDRLAAISSALNSIGGKITALDDGLVIEPITEFTGGTVDSCNDHRIAMAAAIASTKSSSPVIIKGAEAVNKSYPDFFNVFNKLGGNSYVISME